MHKLPLTAAAMAAFAITFMAGAPARAQSDDAFVGTAAGGTTGAIAGAVVGGPIGAIIGGFAGATLGAASSVPEPVVAYTTAHPVDPAYVRSDVRVGARVSPAVNVYDVPRYPDYGYFYANDRVYIVDRGSGQVVYSPGYVVPRRTIRYVEQRPVRPSEVQMAPPAQGRPLPLDVPMQPIPSSPIYSYVYLEGQPVIVDNRTRTVVWIRQ